MTTSATASGRVATDASSASAALAIEVTGLRKSYGDKVVLDGVDFTVAPGTVYALLGPNGAGKTTIVNILATLLRPDGGVARVGGNDVVKQAEGVRSVIGLTGQFAAVDGLMTGEENLQLMARLRHLPKQERIRRVTELLEQFDLVEAAKKPLATYSGGMKRRLDLAMTLVGDARIVFLDEPTAGLDPRSRRTMWDIVRRLVADGVTIFLTTQYLDEADHLADIVAVLDNGRIVASGTPGELKKLVPGGHIKLVFADEAALSAADAAFAESARSDAELTLQVPSDGGARSLRSVFDTLDRAGLEVETFEIHTPDLDDVFFALTGHGTAQATESEPAAASESTTASADATTKEG
jgi:ABC-2 type transport system ATP-binding protein